MANGDFCSLPLLMVLGYADTGQLHAVQYSLKLQCVLPVSQQVVY